MVVNWNRRELLRACLESLRQQRFSRFEVIVVDNGSTDGSAQMLREFRSSAGFPMNIIENDRNWGFCAANNQGIAAARGDYIALLNNDAVAEPGWIEEMVRVITLSPEVGMVAAKILVWENPTRIDKIGHLIYPDGQNRGRGTGEIDHGQYDRVEEVLWPDGCAALYRKAMLEEIGGFDEDLFAYADDAELGLRARIAGWKCLTAPAAVVRHHRGATLGRHSVLRLELIERNRILLVVKHFPPSLLWLNLPYYAARLGAGLWAALRGRGEAGHFAANAGSLRLAWAMLRGMAAGLALAPRMWRKRGELKGIRKLTNKQLRTLLLTHKISLKHLSEGVA